MTGSSGQALQLQHQLWCSSDDANTPMRTVHAGNYKSACTVAVTGGPVPLKQLAVTSGGTTATCNAAVLAAGGSTSCTFTRQLTGAEVTAGSLTVSVTATATPDVTSAATITDVADTDSLSQTRTARLSLEHSSPQMPLTTVGE
jgi:hypothetical protein